MAFKRGYKIRSFVNGRSKKGEEYTHYSLTVPSEIAEALPEHISFAPRMTEEGLLYEPVGEDAQQIDLPAWAKQSDNGNNSEKTQSKEK